MEKEERKSCFFSVRCFRDSYVMLLMCLDAFLGVFLGLLVVILRLGWVVGAVGSGVS